MNIFIERVIKKKKKRGEIQGTLEWKPAENLYYQNVIVGNSIILWLELQQ